MEALVDFLSRLNLFSKSPDLTLFLLQVIRKILFKLAGKICEFMSHFMDSFDVLTDFILLSWICMILISSLSNYFSALVLFALDIRVIEVCVIRLFFLLFFCFCLYWGIVGWFDSRIGLFWGWVFRFVHFWEIQRITGRSVHLRSDWDLTENKIKITSWNQIHLKQILRSESSYRLLYL